LQVSDAALAGNGHEGPRVHDADERLNPDGRVHDVDERLNRRGARARAADERPSEGCRREPEQRNPRRDLRPHDETKHAPPHSETSPNDAPRAATSADGTMKLATIRYDERDLVVAELDESRIVDVAELPRLADERGDAPARESAAAAE